MHDAQVIAKALGGEVHGRYVHAPGPGHSKRDRSMWLVLDWQAPDGFICGSMAGDDWQLCKDHIRERLGLDPFGAADIGREKARQVGEANPADRFTADTARAAGKSDDRRQLALEIARASQPIAGSIAETYLARRIGREINWPKCLRFHPECPRGTDHHPALIAIMRDAVTNEFRCIQRVFLKADGSDRLRDARGKMTLGMAAGAACKLSPDDAVTSGLALAEGGEKALAILAAGWGPIWSTQGTATMAAFPMLAGIEALTIFADPGEAGQKAAVACAERWAAAGREVAIRTPHGKGDWDSALREAA